MEAYVTALYPPEEADPDTGTFGRKNYKIVATGPGVPEKLFLNKDSIGANPIQPGCSYELTVSEDQHSNHWINKAVLISNPAAPTAPVPEPIAAQPVPVAPTAPVPAPITTQPAPAAPIVAKQPNGALGMSSNRTADPRQVSIVTQTCMKCACWSLPPGATIEETKHRVLELLQLHKEVVELQVSATPVVSSQQPADVPF